MKVSRNALADSIGKTDEAYIDEVNGLRERSRKRRTRWFVSAAAVLLVIAGAVGAILAVNGKKAKDDVTADVTLSPVKATPSPTPNAAPSETPGSPTGQSFEESSEQLDDYRYLIYNSKFYDRMSVLDDLGIIGERIGEVTEIKPDELYFDREYNPYHIEEETSAPAGTAEPYKEHTGSIIGPIYAVKGYDTDKLVCQKFHGKVCVFYSIFDCGDDGARALLEGCFNVKERLKSLKFKAEIRITDNDADPFIEVYEEIDPELYGDKISAFLDALVNAHWAPRDELNDPDGGGFSVRDNRTGILRLDFGDGMFIDLGVWCNRYIQIYELWHFRLTDYLLLDEEAAMGIADMIRGTPVTVDMRQHDITTLDDCTSDAWLGYAVPQTIPSGFGLENCAISNADPGKEHDGERPDPSAPTRSIELRYREKAGDAQIWVWIVSWDDRGVFDAPEDFIPIEGFTEADVFKMPDDGGPWDYCIYLKVGNAAVRITARGATEEQLTELVRSIRGE